MHRQVVERDTSHVCSLAPAERGRGSKMLRDDYKERSESATDLQVKYRVQGGLRISLYRCMAAGEMTAKARRRTGQRAPGHHSARRDRWGEGAPGRVTGAR